METVTEFEERFTHFNVWSPELRARLSLCLVSQGSIIFTVSLFLSICIFHLHLCWRGSGRCTHGRHSHVQAPQTSHEKEQYPTHNNKTVPSTPIEGRIITVVDTLGINSKVNPPAAKTDQQDVGLCERISAGIKWNCFLSLPQTQRVCRVPSAEISLWNGWTVIENQSCC